MRLAGAAALRLFAPLPPDSPAPGRSALPGCDTYRQPCQGEGGENDKEYHQPVPERHGAGVRGTRLGQTAQGDPGTKVSVTFSTYKTGVFTYDPETGMYAVEEYGNPYVDGNTDGQVQVKNVLVLRTDVSNVPGDEAGRLKVRTTGTGSGLLFCDGTVQEITWSKARDSAPMTYLTPDGQPARLGVGPSYVNIVSNSAQVTVN